jgi:hypothetical protein
MSPRSNIRKLKKTYRKIGKKVKGSFRASLGNTYQRATTSKFDVIEEEDIDPTKAKRLMYNLKLAKSH